ncbi:putative lipid II flippase MurJ [Desulfolithobacter dissulfuricans]|uniref:Lipid II flippase MurJ n=1 Tax=Desulfolithobacter dissulfuricans TaxID=2795293 RepID=A0A915UAN9_9BACT|nr:lipid II flippase MurJ [Desulfolithobacter dissulfuricans]BCO09770.1 putative lipid II flippase MurJ [Desulfolithobacter dissulfuricans]
MKQAVHLGTLSAMSIGIAFLYQWYVLTRLGPGIETDALFAGMTIPQLTLAIISGSLMHVLVPLLSIEGEECLRRDAWSFFALIGGAFTMLAMTLFVTAPWWVPVTVPGFSEGGMDLTVRLTRIQLIGMVFSAVNGVQWAAYHARQRFVWAECTPLLASVIGFLALTWALPRFGVVAAAWISVLRLALQTVLLLPGMGYPARPALKSELVVTSWQRIKPLILGTAYYKTDPVVDRMLLSMAQAGSLSLYYLAQRIYGAVNQVLNKAVAAPMVPRLSRLHQSGKRDEFRRLYIRKLIQIAAISCFGLFALGTVGQLVLELLVGIGRLSEKNVTDLWWIMMWLSGVFIGGALGQISSSAFYACGDTRTPTRISVVSFTLYIPCKVVSFYLWGVMGLALATSIYYMANFLIQQYFFKKGVLA